ncbi:MAG: MFS transporter [Propionibacteriaceae bacterium]|jgi:MFS family permease|nr:MFS transporter [Propionibacteriaceae bacterium]
MSEQKLLNDRSFVVLLIGRTTAMLGFAFGPVALAFGILSLPWGNEQNLSVVLFFQVMPQVLLILFGGVVSDRYPRARVLQLGMFAMGLGWVSIGVMIQIGMSALVPICAAASVTGVAAAVIYPAFTGIIPEIVPADQLQQGNSWLQMASAVAKLFGLVAAGAVVVMLGSGLAVISTGVFYLCAGLLVFFLPVTSPQRTATANMFKQLKEGWKEFSSRQWLWVVVLQYAFVVMMLNASHGVLGPVLAKQELGGPVAWTAILVGEALGAGVGVVVSLRWMPRHPIFVGTLLTLCAGLPGCLLGLSVPVPMVVLAAVTMGFGFEFFTVLWLTTMQLEVPPEALSRVAAYDGFGSLVLGPLGLLIAAPVASALGIHFAIGLSGLVIIAVTLGALCFPEVRRLESRPRALSQAAD